MAVCQCSERRDPCIPVTVATARAFLWCSHLSLSSLLPPFSLLSFALPFPPPLELSAYRIWGFPFVLPALPSDMLMSS